MIGLFRTTLSSILVLVILSIVEVGSLFAQNTQFNTDSLKIKTSTATKILVPGESSANVAFPTGNGVIAIEQGETVYPVGTIQYVLNHLPVPAGFLRADGQAVSRTDYASLFAKIGTTYGAGNGTTTFNLPTIIDPYVPRAGLIGWWPFSGDGNDRWYRKNNAGVNGPAASSDRFSRENATYYFDGVDDNLLVTNTCFNNGWPDWTVAVWANLEAIQRGTFLNTFPHNAMGIGAVAEAKFQVAIGNGTTWLTNGWYTNGSYQANTWYHFCVVKSGLNVKLYIDGILDKEYTLPSAPPNLDCSFYIGRCNCAGEFTKGKLDDLGLWSRALTQDEVAALYRSAHYAVIRWK